MSCGGVQPWYNNYELQVKYFSINKEMPQEKVVLQRDPYYGIDTGI